MMNMTNHSHRVKIIRRRDFLSVLGTGFALGRSNAVAWSKTTLHTLVEDDLSRLSYDFNGNTKSVRLVTLLSPT